jgi:hypothetical protein
MNRSLITAALGIALASLCPPLHAAAKPLKIYILAGQSNMEGHAQTFTIPSLLKDPATAPIHREIMDENGKARVFDDIRISYAYGDFSGKPAGRMSGKLSTGFGSQHHIGTGKIGPELTFGIYTHKALGEPILLIKNAWGGKSLQVDFRPPSGGLPDDEKSRADAGVFYRHMMDHIKEVLADPRKYHPAYDASAGYELAGFVWFQGFNDMVGDYPLKNPKDKGSGKDYSEYSRLLACLIRDVRKELSAPDMPFVVGVLGVGGPKEKPDAFRQSMAAPAAMPEFKDNVFNVFTEKYFPVELNRIEKKINEISTPFNKRKSEIKRMPMEERRKAEKKLTAEMEAAVEAGLTDEERWLWKNTRSNQGFHYYGSARFFTLAGKAFAEVLHRRGNL